MTLDEEEWIVIESDNENQDETIRYDDDSMEDPISDMIMMMILMNYRLLLTQKS